MIAFAVKSFFTAPIVTVASASVANTIPPSLITPLKSANFTSVRPMKAEAEITPLNSPVNQTVFRVVSLAVFAIVGLLSVAEQAMVTLVKPAPSKALAAISSTVAGRVISVRAASPSKALAVTKVIASILLRVASLAHFAKAVPRSFVTLLLLFKGRVTVVKAEFVPALLMNGVV